jgi:hypothetical protein
VKRRVAQLCLAAGLLLTLAAAALWIRAFYAHDAIDLTTGYKSDRFVVVRVSASISSSAGQLTCRWTEFRGLRGEPLDLRWLDTWIRRRSHEPSRLRPTAGFGYERSSSSDSAQWIGQIPLWFVFAVGSAFVAISVLALQGTARRRRRAAGVLCQTCEYDLRGAAHERCPECGDVVARPASV